MSRKSIVSPTGRILVVDDEPMLLRAFARGLQQSGHEVVTATNGRDAYRWLEQPASLDVIVSDIRMPEMSGLSLLRVVHERDPDLPVVLLTGDPDLSGAIEAIDNGAYKYIPKPVDLGVLCDTVQRAIAVRRMAALKREALALLDQSTLRDSDRAALDASFERALSTAWMAYQPIVVAQDERIFGYESLLRFDEPSFLGPGAVIDAAEHLGRLEALGRRVRALAPEPMVASDDTALFVNLHPRDLSDETLFSTECPLARIASRVVLEITERATIEGIRDVRERIGRLRQLGYRLAIDDLGAGYSGLSTFALVEPDVVKLDIALIRDVDTNSVKRRVVDRMTGLAHDLGAVVVAEGVETPAERDTLTKAGCDLLQGYLFARPGRPFPGVTPRG